MVAAAAEHHPKHEHHD